MLSLYAVKKLSVPAHRISSRGSFEQIHQEGLVVEHPIVCVKERVEEVPLHLGQRTNRTGPAGGLFTSPKQNVCKITRRRVEGRGCHVAAVSTTAAECEID